MGKPVNSNHGVAFGQRCFQGGLRRLHRVRHEWKDFWNCAGPFHERSEQKAVGFVNFARRQRLVILDQFAAGGQQGHARPAGRFDFADTDGRKQSGQARCQATTCFGELCAVPDVFSLQPDVVPGFDGVEKPDLIGPARLWPRVFLRDNCVRAVRQR